MVDFPPSSGRTPVLNCKVPRHQNFNPNVSHRTPRPFMNTLQRSSEHAGRQAFSKVSSRATAASTSGSGDEEAATTDAAACTVRQSGGIANAEHNKIATDSRLSGKRKRQREREREQKRKELEREERYKEQRE